MTLNNLRDFIKTNHFEDLFNLGYESNKGGFCVFLMDSNGKFVIMKKG